MARSIARHISTGGPQTWRELDPEDFPFVHEIIDEFDGHDDADQFRAALDLTLAGLRLQAGA